VSIKAPGCCDSSADLRKDASDRQACTEFLDDGSLVCRWTGSDFDEDKKKSQETMMGWTLMGFMRVMCKDLIVV